MKSTCKLELQGTSGSSFMLDFECQSLCSQEVNMATQKVCQIHK